MPKLNPILGWRPKSRACGITFATLVRESTNFLRISTRKVRQLLPWRLRTASLGGFLSAWTTFRRSTATSTCPLSSLFSVVSKPLSSSRVAFFLWYRWFFSIYKTMGRCFNLFFSFRRIGSLLLCWNLSWTLGWCWQGHRICKRVPGEAIRLAETAGSFAADYLGNVY